MDLYELNELIKSEGVKNDLELLSFYKQKKRELIKLINAGINQKLTSLCEN